MEHRMTNEFFLFHCVAHMAYHFVLGGGCGIRPMIDLYVMKQKLALIAALCHDPKLILMDEPFVGLDPKASHLLKETMHEHCERGGAIFFSTHVLEVAEKLCDKIAIIKKGQLRAYTSLKDLAEQGIELERYYLDIIYDGNDEHVPYVEEAKEEAAE